MSLPRRLWNRLQRWQKGADLLVWYHPSYRLPLASIEHRTGVDPRRADLAAWTLLHRGVIDASQLRQPKRATWEQIGRVHPDEWLDRLVEPETLARIFAVETSEVSPKEVLDTVRLAVGGTVDAARAAISRGGPTLNLHGGFHHAARAGGGGFCAVNDQAVALRLLRDEGLEGTVVFLDLDAHPPDGLADCLQHEEDVWLGSLSGADWGPLPGEVDETVLPPGTDDAAYLEALEALLSRLPKGPVLAFVLAGGDVRAEDHMSELELTEAGVRSRDLRVRAALGDTPSVWMPGGGYGPRSWRVLYGTACALALGKESLLPEDLDPLSQHYGRISRELRQEDLEGDAWLTEDDLADALGLHKAPLPRFLDFYSEAGVELALARFGTFEHLRRLGYEELDVELGEATSGDRIRVWGHAQGRRCLLIEVVAERRETGGRKVLFINWLTLRHPLVAFRAGRPALPGQEVPGLGMLREAVALLLRVASRLKLEGLAMRPAWVHVAYTARHDFHFMEPGRQGRFRALLRDLGHLSLVELTTAVSEGKVLRNGEPYQWEAEPMVCWEEDQREPTWWARVAEVVAEEHFSLSAEGAQKEPER